MINILPLMKHQVKLTLKIHKIQQLMLKIILTIMQQKIKNHLAMVIKLHKNHKETTQRSHL